MFELRDARVVLPDGRRYGPYNLALTPGRWVGVVGPSGSGKSLLARVLAGLLPLSSGVRKTGIAGGATEERQAIAYLPGHEPFDPWIKVKTILRIRATLRGLRGAKRRRLLEKAAEAWNLVPIWEQRLGYLKRGVRRRVALAEAFLSRAWYIVVDDPFWGADDLQIRYMREGLAADRRKDQSVVLLTRSGRELLLTVDRFVELGEGGGIRFAGPASEWQNRRADAGQYKLVVRGNGGEIQRILKRITGVYDVLWYEGGMYNTYEVRCESAPRVRELVFRILAAKGCPIVEFSPEVNPYGVPRKRQPAKPAAELLEENVPISAKPPRKRPSTRRERDAEPVTGLDARGEVKPPPLKPVIEPLGPPDARLRALVAAYAWGVPLKKGAPPRPSSVRDLALVSPTSGMPTRAKPLPVPVLRPVPPHAGLTSLRHPRGRSIGTLPSLVGGVNYQPGTTCYLAARRRRRRRLRL